MFRGKAELRNPETDAKVGALTERCENDGTAHLKVELEPALTLTGTEFLMISSSAGELFSATATNGGPTEIREFHSKSPVGCLAANSEVSLTRSPGGPLSTLLVVLAQGTIHEEHH
ncbi:MAG TPA: hypothetical protein VK741_21930 [Acetobacteraceae bacterium]|jgi:hypothetical protein|nr:hypothetical protein [Acetobacteraceae bacterium]